MQVFCNMRNLLRHLWSLLERLNLLPEMDNPEQILAAIARDAQFRGINLWILITATVIASVGLNVNSTAVIIGAMLISPLMGPIIGIGASLAIYEVEIFRKSLRNLLVALLFTLTTSAIYFALSPLKEPGSELEARTTPTFWDVMIAFFGGLSGIIAALGRDKRTNVIAGVAIATALMPPLCTAGYGLGTLQWRFFIGALYLFLINAVFISASAYVTLQVIRFPNREFVDKAYQRRIRRLFLGIVVATLLPSFYVAYTVVKDAVEETQVRRFLEEAFAPYPLTSVVEHKRRREGEKTYLRVVVVGEPLSAQQIAALHTLLHTTYRLPQYTLEIVQGASPTKPIAAEIAELLDSLEHLSQKLALHEAARREREALTAEARILFPELRAFTAMPIELNGETLLVGIMHPPLSKAQTAKLEEWMKVRTGKKAVAAIAVE